jgi:hypothetical protein
MAAAGGSRKGRVWQSSARNHRTTCSATSGDWCTEPDDLASHQATRARFHRTSNWRTGARRSETPFLSSGGPTRPSSSSCRSHTGWLFRIRRPSCTMLASWLLADGAALSLPLRLHVHPQSAVGSSFLHPIGTDRRIPRCDPDAGRGPSIGSDGGLTIIAVKWRRVDAAVRPQPIVAATCHPSRELQPNFSTRQQRLEMPRRSHVRTKPRRAAPRSNVEYPDCIVTCCSMSSPFSS